MLNPHSSISHPALRFNAVRLASGALFLLVCFAMLAPAMSPRLETLGPAAEGNLLRQVLYIGVFGVALLCSGVLRQPGRLRVIPLSIVLVLLWATLSVGWAVNPGVAVRRLFLTVIVLLSIFLLIDRSGYERSVRMVQLALVLILLVNYVAVAGWPQWNIHQASEGDPSIVGAWHGVLMQKNFAGAHCAFTILFLLLDGRRVRPALRLVLVALAAYFLYRTESKTSMGLLGFALVAGVGFRSYNPYYRVLFLIAVGVVLALLLAIGFQYSEALMAPFESEDALTGRVQIWPVLIAYWREHWLLGAGFGSFWNVGDPQPIAAYSDAWVADIASGHNGYLDLLVQMGLPGLLLALNAALLVPVWKLASVRRMNRGHRSLILAVLLFAIGHNFTESSLFDRDAAVNVFLFIAIALLGLETRSAQSGAASPLRQAVPLPRGLWPKRSVGAAHGD